MTESAVTQGGQAAYEVWRAAVPDVVCNVPGGAWEDLPAMVQAGFNAVAAQAGRPAPDLSGLRTCYCGMTARVVSGVFPHPDCDGSVEARPAANPGVMHDAETGEPLPPYGGARPAPELVPAPVLADAMAESRRYREALEHVRAIILEGDNSTEGSRLRRSRAVIRAALEGK